MKIKRNDIVIVTSGAARTDKGAKVLLVDREKGRALVEGVKLMKRHTRKTQDNPKGGIIEREAPIALANLMLYCPQCKKGVKAANVIEGDKKIRKCRKCKHAFDA